MNRLVSVLAACAVCAAAACGDDADQVAITLFQASPDAIEMGQPTTLVFVVSPPEAQTTISNVGDVTGQTQASVSPTDTTVYRLTATRGTATATRDVTVTVGPRSAVALTLDPATATPTAGAALAITLTAITSDGKTAPGFRGTVQLSSTDAHAELPGDITFAASDAGVKHVAVTLKAAGVSTLTAADKHAPGTQGVASLTVQPAAASAYELSTLPASATAGEALVLTITARDAFGNPATSYAGQAQVTSGDASDILPASGAFTAGVRSVTVAFTRAGSHVATVSELGGPLAADTTSVDVAAGPPFRIAVTAANAATIAGTAEAFTARIVDFYDNPCTGYLGTLHFASSDTTAVVPADTTFVPGDAGAHGFTATLKAAGSDTLAISDTRLANVTGAIAWTVGAAAAASCVTSQAPPSAVAGSSVGVAVTVHDAFGNLASGYTGTMRLTATDPRATLPADATYAPGVDAGSHVFSTALVTAGSQVLTATDTAIPEIQCTAPITITPGAPRLVLAMAGDASAGYAVTIAVAVKDLFDNAVPGYAGTVTFTTSDPGAAAPAPIVFQRGGGGVASTSATFVTLGAQTIAASDGGAPAATGSATATVHGLVYTAPTQGRVRLVANAARSNTQVVQLDLVANERLEVSTFFSGGGPGSFAAGMNLPLDTGRVGPDTTLFAAGNALVVGTALPVAIGRIGSDHVLYTAVSRKRVPGRIFTQGTEVQAGQVFYSVRLKLPPSTSLGPVFDGTRPSPLFRAAVRDQYGDDFVSQSDVGVGKLEVR